ncbi:class I SAM-dependent methyltransferase [Georgenia halophila]|uniref:Class I SAM-dependent methyltransferase n=1 Tax=Georgenia halophila TaxID=620889 RepID=A0ABP8KUH1_9MICO
MATQFTAKAAPEGDKLRGGYYTPEPIARFITDWVSAAGSKVLEPACGDGAILEHLVRAASIDQVTAVELIPEEAAKAASIGADVEVSDFFAWLTPQRQATFDGVAGNPPYIRFGSWDPSSRELALDLMRTQGMRPTKLTNAWVPFVVGSLLAVRSGGRVGLVLPAELLQVGYAAALRSYLVDNCSSITVVAFKQLVFPGILQEVVLLLAERGDGPAVIRTVELTDATNLDAFWETDTSAVRAPLHDSEKWTKYFLDTEAIELLRSVRRDHRLTPLGTYADVNVGVVTGRNSFFCMTKSEVDHRGLADFTMPLVARSTQVGGLHFTNEDLDEQDGTTARTRLLTVSQDVDLEKHPQLASYLAAGEGAGVPQGYKCRIRRAWWEVPSLWAPDGFMLRQISTHPRLIANSAGATSTDTVHRVRVKDGVDMKRLAVGAFNSATFALSEVLGRSYGGGILELEPSECGLLPVVDPTVVSDTLHQKVDELVRERRFEDALDLVDERVLVESLGFRPEEVAALRRAWVQLRDRRAARSKRA